MAVCVSNVEIELVLTRLKDAINASCVQQVFLPICFSRHESASNLSVFYVFKGNPICARKVD